ncbi:hypothetical protein MLD38_015619 [Melastoma candidum]|uniref:Uncharacterized protein n=1 Tax=Melastoma candidum TaxID=119954 RepID=A0ACB9RGV7_9MYRT|nr:hypothetical protein MLD38_015619 [Melastoma candidum]
MIPFTVDARGLDLGQPTLSWTSTRGAFYFHTKLPPKLGNRELKPSYQRTQLRIGPRDQRTRVGFTLSELLKMFMGGLFNKEKEPSEQPV